MHQFVEARILKSAPGYSIIRESIVQIMGNERPAFSQVALVDIFNNDTLMTAFITDMHPNGHYSVFVPTGPNPMSGNIYHLDQEHVQLVNTPVSEAMRSIISCGAGSAGMFESRRDHGPPGVARYRSKDARPARLLGSTSRRRAERGAHPGSALGNGRFQSRSRSFQKNLRYPRWVLGLAGVG